jgi:hypothetical protein
MGTFGGSNNHAMRPPLLNVQNLWPLSEAYLHLVLRFSEADNKMDPELHLIHEWLDAIIARED